jgi:hypothetical protein
LSSQRAAHFVMFRLGRYRCASKSVNNLNALASNVMFSYLAIQPNSAA